MQSGSECFAKSLLNLIAQDVVEVVGFRMRGGSSGICRRAAKCVTKVAYQRIRRQPQFNISHRFIIYSNCRENSINRYELCDIFKWCANWRKMLPSSLMSQKCFAVPANIFAITSIRVIKCRCQHVVYCRGVVDKSGARALRVRGRRGGTNWPVCYICIIHALVNISKTLLQFVQCLKSNTIL